MFFPGFLSFNRIAVPPAVVDDYTMALGLRPRWFADRPLLSFLWSKVPR